MAAHKNVIYIEPNYYESWNDDNITITESNGNTVGKGVHELSPKLEDYCVAIDLEVEIMERSNGSFTHENNSDGRRILFSWSTTNGTASFNSGKNYVNDTNLNEPHVVKSINYLSTAPTEYGTFADMVKYGTNECFGINSIDISYNNYAVPEVTIVFTDIRGMSLFGQEELRHSAKNDNGVGGFVDSDVAGSFFKCFFTVPYPKFRLMVKGFYGEPTAYELCCADFRANFDCKTGNFGATARFIGYSYSMLNDITMNALVSAPYCEYVGKEYWEKKTNTSFVVDGNKMPTFVDIINKIKDIKVDINRQSNESEISLEAKKYDDEAKYISTVIDTYKDYFHSLYEKLAELKIEDDANNPISDENTFTLILLNTTDESKTLNSNFNFDELNTKYSRFERALNDYNVNYGRTLIAPKIFNNFSFVSITDEDMQNRLKKTSIPNKQIFANEDYKYVQLYDNSSFAKDIEEIRLANQNNVTSVQQQLADSIDELIKNHLGFQPTVENITSILMAHLDTLIHCIYYCANEVNKLERKASKLGLLMSDVKYKDEIVPPFPKVTFEKPVNGVNKLEEGWMADLPGGASQPEVNLIEGLLKSTMVIADVFKECADEMQELNANPQTQLNMVIPLTPLDIVCNTEPFGTEILYSTPSDFIGKLGLRMFNLFATNNVCKDFSKMGVADAINFVTTMPTPNETFLSRINNGIYNTEVIFNALLGNVNDNSVKEMMINEKRFIWNSSNDVGGKPLYKNVSNGNGTPRYMLNQYYSNNVTALPVKEFDFDKINNDMLGTSLPSTEKYIFNKYENVSGNCDNYFKIDLNYQKYPQYQTLMKVNDEKLNYVDKLGIGYSIKDYVNDYFTDDYRFCGCFNAEKMNVITYECGKDSWLLPSHFPTIEEVKSSEAFSSGYGYAANFNTLKNYSEGTMKLVHRNEKKKISSCYDEIENIETYTYTSFYGIYEGELTDKFSLFGQSEYYLQSSNEAKALLFLDTIAEMDYGWSTKTDFGGYKFEKVVNDLVDANTHFLTVPYCAILLCGAYLYRYESQDDIISYGLNLSPRERNERIVHGNKINSNLFNLYKPIKNALIDEFTKWVNGTNNGLNQKQSFKNIQDSFELKTLSNKGVVDILNEIGTEFTKAKGNLKEINESFELNNYINFEHYLSANFTHQFYENYISINSALGKVKLYNRETSINVKAFVGLFVRPCTVIKTTKFILNGKYDMNFAIGNDAKTYLSAFLNELKNQYKSLDSNVVAQANVRPLDTEKDIKICLYRYIKTLWDKWLSGDSEEHWSYEKFYKGNWFFIDSFYNKIGQIAKLNIIDFSSDIMYSQSEYSYSLLSFISKAYAKNNFGFYTVQNFLDMCDSSVAENNMAKLFKPIPYESMSSPSLNTHPSFIILYTYEYSSKLNMDDSQYYNDSYNIGTEDYQSLPKPITNKTKDVGYRIPAFGVSYGKQYQSYFKDISVSMDSPMVTEHALRAQFEIASMHGKEGENGKNVTILGQDLYTIYSNNSYTCTVRMMGCAWIQPLMCFNLLNIPLFSGTYLIQKVQHTIKPGNMETVFVGTRMSATSQHFLENPFFSKTNNEVKPNEENVDYENTIASIDNDCKYKFFNPLANYEPPLSSDELNMSVGDYIKKYKLVKPSNTSLTNDNISIKELFARTAQAEANNQNQLGIDMVVTVLFNRFMHYGKDITQMFVGNQHAISSSQASKKFIDSVEKIFTNYPLDLVGKRTNIYKSIPYLNKGVHCGHTSPKELIIDDVKKMDGYCTTPGYDETETNRENREPLDGWWRMEGEYIAQHDTSSSALGHVFVGGFQGYGKRHWEMPEIKTKSSDSKISSEAEGLFIAIEKTVKTSTVLDITEIKLEETKSNNSDTFYITCKPSSGLANVYDIIVNTYYDYVTEVGWLVRNDGKELPYKIKVTTRTDRNNTQNTKVVIAKLNNDETLNVLNQYENLNENFYKVLKKKYSDSLGTSKSFQIDCLNFSSLFAKQKNGWDMKVNELLSISEIMDCGKSINYNTTEGYSWDGSSNPNNKNKPSGKFTEYSSSTVVSVITQHNTTESRHQCAKAVHLAMEEGSESAKDIIQKSKPYSACVYAKFLPTWGFSEVYSGFGKEMHNFKPNPGDIAVIAGKVSTIESEQHGHIQIYGNNDGYWYSDYKCDKAYCYGDEGRPFKIFRWNNG